MKQLGVLILFVILLVQSLSSQEERRQQAAIEMRDRNEIKALVWEWAQRDSRR